MTVKTSLLRTGAAMVFGSLLSAQVFAHGDMAPQAIDTSMLPQLGEEWLEENPYVGHKEAITLGESAYAQNCARCHGLDAQSGGIAPDLRYLEPGLDGDEWYVYRVRNGAVRNGVPYMPKMADHLSQEALWAIRAWLLTKHVAQ